MCTACMVVVVYVCVLYFLCCSLCVLALCVQLEERARKAVEQATSSTAVLKLYNKWLEKGQEGEGGEVEKKGGLLKTLKSAIHKSPSKESTVSMCICILYIMCVDLNTLRATQRVKVAATNISDFSEKHQYRYI